MISPRFLPSVAYATQDPGSLIRFFAILAVSSGPDLGIDTSIGVIDAYNSRFTFTIDGKAYRTSEWLYDGGAMEMCGRGTRSFSAQVDGEATTLVIKDCWLEDRQDRTLEHDVVEKVRSAVGQAEFRRRFIDICGHHITRNAALGRVCEILKRDFNKQDGFYVVPIHRHVVEPKKPPRPRFRYQVVYREKGESFYHVKSLQKAYLDLNQVTKGKVNCGVSFWSLNVISQPSTVCIHPSSFMGMSVPEIFSVSREEQSCRTWSSRENAMWTN